MHTTTFGALREGDKFRFVYGFAQPRLRDDIDQGQVSTKGKGRWYTNSDGQQFTTGAKTAVMKM